MFNRVCAALVSSYVSCDSSESPAAHLRERERQTGVWFVAGEVLTKAIQACLTNLHSYSRNAGCGKKDSVDPNTAPGGAHFPHENSRY